jgi:hypothetical protein
MKHLLLLVLVIALPACNSPQRYMANNQSAEAWLAGHVGKAAVNVSGKWKDATYEDWGDAEFLQRGNKITGTLGGYEVNGVVNGSRVYLALMADKWYYYSVEAQHSGSVLKGRYSRGVPVQLTKNKSREFEFRRLSRE